MKIALIGSAPSSVQLAPYDDPSWTIWGCSPGALPHARRIDTWFELHPLDHVSIGADYIKQLAAIDRPVYLIEPSQAIPKGLRYPREEMTEQFGPYFWSSSLSWMLALAISQKPEAIGLWGVDMSANEEYQYQRPGCHHFLQVAKDRGIQVELPDQSDLLRAPSPYGYVFGSKMYRKLRTRAEELDARIAAAAAEYENKRNEWHFLKGAREDLEYILNTWIE